MRILIDHSEIPSNRLRSYFFGATIFLGTFRVKRKLRIAVVLLPTVSGNAMVGT